MGVKKCIICGKRLVKGLSGVQLTLCRGDESWADVFVPLCALHRAVVWEGVKAKVNEAVKEAGE